MDFSSIVGQCTDFQSAFQYLINEQGMRLLTAMFNKELGHAWSIWTNATQFAVTETTHGTGRICLLGYGSMENLSFSLPEDVYTSFGQGNQPTE